MEEVTKMPETRQAGNVARRLASSGREELRRLCEKSNTELLALMGDLLELPEEQFDPELFDAAQDLLDERAPVCVSVDPQAAAEDFRRRYGDLLAEIPAQAPKAAPAARKRRAPRRIFSGLVAAVLIVLLANSIVAVASRQNPLQAVFDFGETLVRTVTQGSSGELELPEDTEGYRSLKEAYEATGAHNAMNLTWIPSRFTLDSVDVQTAEGDGESSYKYLAYFESDDGEFIFVVTGNPYEESSMYNVKNATKNEPIILNDVEFDVAENYMRVQAQWSYEGYAYMISGDVSREEVNTMILALK